MRGLATAQSALATRLDALERDLRRMPTNRDDAPDAARLRKLQEAVADLAAGHHDVHKQLEALTSAVEQFAAELDGDAEASGGADTAADDRPRPASFVPPVAQRGWRPRLKGWARVVLRSTLGKARHLWDTTHPRPPWGDEIRMVEQGGPAKLPSLTVIFDNGPDTATVAEIETWLERQTDHDIIRQIRDSDNSSGVSSTPIDTDYAWDVGPGFRDLPATFIESARRLLASETLGFVCFVASDGSAPQWLVARDLRHGDGGLDTDALCRRAKRRPGRVLGKIAGGDDELLPRLLCRPRIRRRVRRSGRYVLAVATKPRTVKHALCLAPAEIARPRQSDEDQRPGVLLLLTSTLAGGLERVVAAMLEDLAAEVRWVIATDVPQTAWSATRWRALERFTPHVHALGDIFDGALHAALLQELIARHDLGSVLHAGSGEAWPALAADLRRGLPRLRLAEPSLRPTADSPVATAADDAGKRLRRELGWPADALLIAMCADLIAEQRPEDFLTLAHRFRDDDRFRFLLIGDGPRSADIRDLERLFDLGNLRVERPGRDLGEVLEAADVICTTAESDPFPYTLLAALNHQRPVVAPAVDDLPRLLKDGPCGVVVPHPGDVDGFEEALRSLAEDELRKELGAHGPRAVNHFDADDGPDAWRQALGLQRP